MNDKNFWKGVYIFLLFLLTFIGILLDGLLFFLWFITMILLIIHTSKIIAKGRSR